MPHQDFNFPRTKPSIKWAIAVSLIFHAAVLFVSELKPRVVERPARRIEATLAPRPSVPPVTPPPVAAPAPAEKTPARPQNRPKVLALEKSPEKAADAPAPAWTTAQRDEMKKFLGELDTQAKAGPDLAQRSLAMAGAVGRQQARQDDAETELVQRRPNSPPVDQLGLEMYLDGLVSKLNRSAAFVRNTPRSRGVKTATVLVRINPNGSLQSFTVLNAADQQGEIGYIQSVVERAVPFPNFPASLEKSAQSLAMIICIFPATSGDGFGFSRMGEGRRC